MTNTRRLVLVCILILAGLFRFYNLPGLFHWTMDEEYWSYIPFNIATGYHFPLIGGSIADTGLYTTPWFVYLMAPVSLFGGGNPLFFAFLVSGIGVLTTFLIYALGKRLVASKVALLASLIYAGSTLISLWDRHYWNASLAIILSLGALYLTYEALVNDTKKFVWLGFVLALAVSAHGTGLSLVLFVILSSVFLPRLAGWLRPSIKGLAILGLSGLPLVFFELRHDFLQSRALINYLTLDRSGQENIATRLALILTTAITTWGKILGFSGLDVNLELTIGDKAIIPGAPLVLAVVIVLIVIGYYGIRLVRRKPEPLFLRLCLLMIASTVMGLVLFRSPISAYYLLPSVVAFVYLFASLLTKIARRPLGAVIVWAIATYFISFNIGKLAALHHSGSYSKKLAVAKEVIVAVDSKPFTLTIDCQTQCSRYGYRYLFTYLQQEPVLSYMDSHFDWLYHDRLAKLAPLRDVVLLDDGQKVSVITSESLPGQ